MSLFTLAKSEDLQNVFWSKMDGFGKISDRIASLSQKMKNRYAEIPDFQNPRAKTITTDRMAVLVQRAVLDMMQAIFHLPVTACQRLKVRRKDGLRIKTRNEIASVAGFEIRSMPDLPVDAKTDTTIRDSQ